MPPDITQTPPAATLPPPEPTATGIMRNADLLAELHKQRDAIALLTQKSAAMEERAFHLAASLKDLSVFR